MRQVTKDLNKLKDEDLVTILLYCIYKFSDDPEYATLSELAYALDKDSLYNLCATFGGTTLKIPTLQEYKTMVNVMLVFEYVNSDGLSFSEACDKVGIDKTDDNILNMYNLMMEILDTYEEE